MPDQKISRKKFLKFTGVLAAGLGLAGCELNSIPPEEEEELNLGPDPRPDDYAVYLGSGDTGVLNLAYMITQLEAAFYTNVTNSPYAEITLEERLLLNDVRDHEIAHRDFLNDFLGENSIQGLNFDFFDTDFSSRSSVLNTARKIEDVGISAYNIMPELLDQTKYVELVNKLVSVEARHATTVRNFMDPESLYTLASDQISSDGLDVFNSPIDILRNLGPYIVEKIDISELPRLS